MTNKRQLKSASAVPPTWVDRTSNNEEENAATRIQATYRGYFLRKLARGYVKGEFIVVPIATVTIIFFVRVLFCGFCDLEILIFSCEIEQLQQ